MAFHHDEVFFLVNEILPRKLDGCLMIPISRINSKKLTVMPNKNCLFIRTFTSSIAVVLLAVSVNVSAYGSDDYDDYEGGRECAGVMSDYLTPESETMRDQSFNGYYNEDGEDNEENGMVEFISPDAEDLEDVREDYPEEDWG